MVRLHRFSFLRDLIVFWLWLTLTTGRGAGGRNFRFDGIRIIGSAHVLSATRRVPEATVTLHKDGDGTPGDLIYRLNLPDDFLNTTVDKEYTLAAPPGAVLASDTSYWVIFSSADYVFLIAATSNNAEDENPTDGWSITDNSYQKSTGGWSSRANIIRMSVFGSPIATYQEPTDRDFPGAGHNAHETLGIVTPGIVSTGHLTPGLDRNHGLYGDYWWLETQRGHSYRIEVEFGNNPDNNTGGSAWMSFIDPDHDDYPYASGCCEADHNRDDGHTFVHFRRSKDDWNNRYLVHIAVFDKLNHNSRTYNGPYTITMTDITGTVLWHQYRWPPLTCRVSSVACRTLDDSINTLKRRCIQITECTQQRSIFSSLNVASKCLLGNVANEPCAASCGGRSLMCRSAHKG